MTRFAQRTLLACALTWLPVAAPGQPFPSGPISLVVPLAPGDAADVAARALGEEISKLLKTPVLAINRPGAGGAIGTNSVVHARKDGHTILFAQNSALTFRAVLDPQSVTYDALRDLVPLGTASRTPTILVVRRDAPYKTFAALIEYSKKNPGQVRIGHPGIGSVGDFGVQLISALTGAELVSVPYSGAAPAIVALRGEHIEGVVLSLGALSAHIKSGAFRGLVASSRFPEMVDIPTLRELGYQEELFGIWFSFLAPVGIPEDARKALVGAIEQAVKSPTATARLASLGIVQSYAAPEQTAAEIRAESKRVGEMARKTGLVR
ncbi:MAG: Bug family tripartite tricarboxylate transporter substrate binding protein [Burkholderiaceae bacterium]